MMVIGPNPKQGVEGGVVKPCPHGELAELSRKLHQWEISAGQDGKARSDLHNQSSVLGLGFCYGYVVVERSVQRRSKRK